MSLGPAWARPVWTAGGVVTGTHRPAVPVRLFRAGKVLPILAGPGLLDVRERPGVRGGLRGARGLHRPQVLHPGGKRYGDRLLEGGSWGAFTTRRALPAPAPAPGGSCWWGLRRRTAGRGRGRGRVCRGGRGAGARVSPDTAGHSWLPVTVPGGGSESGGGVRGWGPAPQ